MTSLELKSCIEDKLKINQEEFEKMTELEREWELFRRAELKEQIEKWINIKSLHDLPFFIRLTLQMFTFDYI